MGCCLLGYLINKDIGIVYVGLVGIFGIGNCNIVDDMYI